MSRLDAAGEPSMDEILAQIRKIIADEPSSLRADPSKVHDRRAADRGTLGDATDRKVPPPLSERRNLDPQATATQPTLTAESLVAPPLPRESSYPTSRSEPPVDIALPLPHSALPQSQITSISPVEPLADAPDDLSDLIEVGEPSVAISPQEKPIEADSRRVLSFTEGSPLSAIMAPIAAPAAAVASNHSSEHDEVLTVPASAAADDVEDLMAEADQAPLVAPAPADVTEPAPSVARESAPAIETPDSPVLSHAPASQPALAPMNDAMESALGALAAGLAATSVQNSLATAILPVAVPHPEIVAEARVTAPIELAPKPQASSPPDVGAVAVAPTVPQSQPTVAPVPTAPGTEASDNASLEDTMADLLRPMLRQWLDTNMPRIVERALRVEMAKSKKPKP